MTQHRSGKTRLKIYIPELKFRSWEQYLEENDSNSEFSFNFSRWVRSALSVLPKSNQIPVFPVISNETDLTQHKREKTIWVPVEMKQALMREKGHLSLNAYILLVLDLTVFGGTSKNRQIFRMINLQQRIEEMERQLRQIEDQAYIKFPVKKTS